VARSGRLAFGTRHRGARAYVAIDGGVTTTPILGSRATHTPSHMGGFNGRALVAGDRVPLGPAAHRAVRRAGNTLAASAGEAIVRVLPGPQDDYFVPEVFDTLASVPYNVGVQSNRIGFRLQGPALLHARRPDIISDPAPIGSVQVPASGQPIVLMADRQTTGGYPKLATVISADIGVMGQLAPGDAVRLRRCTFQEALAARIAREQTLLALEGRR